MTDLKLIFDEETMLRLTNEQFKQLVVIGETVTEFAPAKEYYIDEDFSRLFLSFDGSSSDFFFEFEPEEDINNFIKNSYLTEFFPKTGKIKLISKYDQPLEKLLLNKQVEINDILQIAKDKFSEEQKIFTGTLNQNAVDSLLKTGDIKGLISCCECGIPGCASTYLWAKEFIVLISFHIESSELQQVCLYPFKLV